MKAVIFAGGLGTRLGGETTALPKPMIEIGGKPVLWHIMKHYSAYNVNEFIICLGYKGYLIKEYFANYFLHVSDVTFDIANNSMEVHEHNAEPWKVTLVDTGEDSQTGGRLKSVADHLEGDDFCLTYGDALSNVDIGEEIKFHQEQGNFVTITAVQPPGRFGALKLDGDNITGFQEKPQGAEGWVNGGFYLVSPKALDYIDGDHITWEGPPLDKLAQENNLSYFYHKGFWKNIDTLRDITHLEDLWCANKAHLRTWQ